MLPILASLLILQATTAAAVTEAPLEAGRWVLRKTAENGTGLGGLSASLLSDDGLYRLVVRCDYSYGDNLSLQFIPILTSTTRPVSETRLAWTGDKEGFPLIWESAGPGVFARDGEDGDTSASATASDLEARAGRLRAVSQSAAGTRIRADFDSREGRDAVRAVMNACSGG